MCSLKRRQCSYSNRTAHGSALGFMMLIWNHSWFKKDQNTGINIYIVCNNTICGTLDFKLRFTSALVLSSLNTADFLLMLSTFLETEMAPVSPPSTPDSPVCPHLPCEWGRGKKRNPERRRNLRRSRCKCRTNRILKIDRLSIWIQGSHHSP